MRLRQRQLDRFIFHITLGEFVGTTPIGKELLFCIRYQVSGQEFWDNNHRSNYSVVFKRLLSDSATPKAKAIVKMEETPLSKLPDPLISHFEDTESLLESIRAGQFQLSRSKISTKSSTSFLPDSTRTSFDSKKQKFTEHGSNHVRPFRDFRGSMDLVGPDGCRKSHMSPNSSNYKRFMEAYCFV